MQTIPDYIRQWFRVIENMNTSATYKPAWGRAIVEICLEKEDVDLTISFDEISNKILKYYWNQVFFFDLRQNPKGKNTNAVERIVRSMIQDYLTENEDQRPQYYERVEHKLKKNEKRFKRNIKKISSKLKENVSHRFLNVNTEVMKLYVLDENERLIYLIKDEVMYIKEYAFTLTQLFNFRWVMLLEKYNNAPKIANKIKGEQEGINRGSLSKFRKILLESVDTLQPVDFYTGKILQDNDISVDHVIPWSFIYSDDLWNLVLTSNSENSKKGRSIVSKEIINKLKQRNLELIKKLNDTKYIDDLILAQENNYVEKFYRSLKG